MGLGEENVEKSQIPTDLNNHESFGADRIILFPCFFVCPISLFEQFLGRKKEQV